MKSAARLAAIAIAAALPALLNAQEHAFSVKDDIAMVRFSDPSELATEPGSNIVHTSPDGEHYAIVTTKGLLGRSARPLKEILTLWGAIFTNSFAC